MSKHLITTKSKASEDERKKERKKERKEGRKEGRKKYVRALKGSVVPL